jgi:hypothetical protein
MTEEEKKQLFERIEKRTNEVADEDGNISFEDFLRLTKEFFGEYSVDSGKTFDEYLARCKEADINAPEPELGTTNAEDLPF